MSTDDPQGTQHRTAPLVGNSHVMTHTLESALGPATGQHPQDAALEQFHTTHGNQEAVAAAKGGGLGTAAQDVVRAGAQTDLGWLPPDPESQTLWQEWIDDGTFPPQSLPWTSVEDCADVPVPIPTSMDMSTGPDPDDGLLELAAWDEPYPECATNTCEDMSWSSPYAPGSILHNFAYHACPDQMQPPREAPQVEAAPTRRRAPVETPTDEVLPDDGEERRAAARGALGEDLDDAFELLRWGDTIGDLDIDGMSEEEYEAYTERFERGMEAQKLMDKLTWLKGHQHAPAGEMDAFRSKLWESNPEIAQQLFGENQTVNEVLETFGEAQGRHDDAIEAAREADDGADL